jgi:hypothetical protein
MDPNATLEKSILAAVTGETDDLREAAEDLADWLDSGGFRPWGRKN